MATLNQSSIAVRRGGCCAPAVLCPIVPAPACLAAARPPASAAFKASVCGAPRALPPQAGTLYASALSQLGLVYGTTERGRDFYTLFLEPGEGTRAALCKCWHAAARAGKIHLALCSCKCKIARTATPGWAQQQYVCLAPPMPAFVSTDWYNATLLNLVDDPQAPGAGAAFGRPRVVQRQRTLADAGVGPDVDASCLQPGQSQLRRPCVVLAPARAAGPSADANRVQLGHSNAHTTPARPSRLQCLRRTR